MLLNQARETIEIYTESPTYIRELVEMGMQLADGCTTAERHTFSSTDTARLEEIPATLRELEQRRELFPTVYGQRFIRERGQLEVLTERLTSLQALILDSRSRFPEEKGVQLLRQSIEALKTMHDLRVTHGCISAKSVAVASDGSFKLGGDLSKLSRRGTDYEKDVKDLGITCLQFFAVKLTEYGTWSEARLLEAVERSLDRYSSSFAKMAKAVLRDMLKGKAATDLYDYVNSWASQSTQPSVKSPSRSEVFSLASSLHGMDLSSNFSSTSRMENTLPLPQSPQQSHQQSLQQSHQQSLQRFPQQHFSQRPSQQPSEQPSQQSSQQPSLSRTRVDLAEHYVGMQILCLKTALDHRVLDETVITKVTNDLVQELKTHGGDIQVEIKPDLFQCWKCMNKKNARERTIIPVCRHAFCKDCYNIIVNACIQNDGLNSIRCPIDSVPFRPFNSEELKENLEVHVIKKLDELILQREMCICPNCGWGYAPTLGDPVTITCANENCKTKFCSYCKGKPHRNCCDLWYAKRH